MATPRIVLDDGLTLGMIGGIGGYSAELLQGVSHLLEPKAAMFDIRLARTRWFRLLPRRLARASYLAGLESYAPLIHTINRADLVHFTNFFAPIWKPVRVHYVVTIHDLVGWEAPDLAPVPSRLWPFIKWSVEKGMETADAIITTTSDSRDRLIKRFGLAPDKFFVIPYAIRQSISLELTESNKRREPFVLFVGRLERRKNVETLISAFDRIADSIPRLQLVLVGSRGFGWESIAVRIENCHVRERIRIYHSAADRELADLYRRASVLVMPSHYEGFGIPIIEAMEAGLPVIASDLQVFRDVGHDAIHYYGQAGDACSLANAIEMLISDPARLSDLADRGKSRAPEFHWERVAWKYLATYSAVLNRQ